MTQWYDPHWLHGYAIDPVTDLPIVGATVSIFKSRCGFRDPEQVTESDSTGRWEFKGLYYRYYDITVEWPEPRPKGPLKGAPFRHRIIMIDVIAKPMKAYKLTPEPKKPEKPEEKLMHF